MILQEVLSTALQMTSDAPLGPILEPLLFIVFHNDLPDSIQTKYSRMFADKNVKFLFIQCGRKC